MHRNLYLAGSIRTVRKSREYWTRNWDMRGEHFCEVRGPISFISTGPLCMGKWAWAKVRSARKIMRQFYRKQPSEKGQPAVTVALMEFGGRLSKWP